jgi:hypothetical protein
MHRKTLTLINSAHMMLAHLGGTASNMIRHRSEWPRPLGGAAIIQRGVQVKGAELKLSRNYRKRYSHVLSDYIAELQLAAIQRRQQRAPLRQAA